MSKKSLLNKEDKKIIKEYEALGDKEKKDYLNKNNFIIIGVWDDGSMNMEFGEKYLTKIAQIKRKDESLEEAASRFVSEALKNAIENEKTS